MIAQVDRLEVPASANRPKDDGEAPLTRARYRLQALVDWERSDRAAMRVDLALESDLMSRLGQPHRLFRAVHVAGTKGKGSVCALIEAGLPNAALRAGRYASPHIEHVSPRRRQSSSSPAGPR